MPSPTLNDRVRERLKDEKALKKFSERDMAAWLQWSQPKVAQKLGGRTDITLNELEALCSVLGIPPSEAVRDRGLEFCAELTPTELRHLETLRNMAPADREAFLHLAGTKKAVGPERYATDPHRQAKARIRK